jgi:hypothetical protein
MGHRHYLVYRLGRLLGSSMPFAGYCWRCPLFIRYSQKRGLTPGYAGRPPGQLCDLAIQTRATGGMGCCFSAS